MVVMIVIMMEVSSSKKKNQDMPKEERWLCLDIVQIQNEREKEFNKSSSFFFAYTQSFSHFSTLSLSLSFSLFSSKDCSSVSELLLPLLSFSLSLSRTICFSISAYIFSCSSHFIRGHAKVNKNSNSSLILSRQESTSSFSVSMQHICKRKKARGRHKTNVKRELRVNVSAEYAL